MFTGLFELNSLVLCTSDEPQAKQWTNGVVGVVNFCFRFLGGNRGNLFLDASASTTSFPKQFCRYLLITGMNKIYNTCRPSVIGKRI